MNIAFLGMFRIISNPAVSQQPQLGKKTTVLGKGYGILRNMKNSTKRIVVAFRLAGEPGRRKLEGFLPGGLVR